MGTGIRAESHGHWIGAWIRRLFTVFTVCPARHYGVLPFSLMPRTDYHKDERVMRSRWDWFHPPPVLLSFSRVTKEPSLEAQKRKRKKQKLEKKKKGRRKKKRNPIAIDQGVGSIWA